LILDIGCGASPIGTVNMDLFYDKSPHTPNAINPRRYRNFIIGDACHLPFKSTSFEVVHASHLLEHLPVPTNCIIEVNRVTKKYAIFKVPNNPSITEYHEHLYSWSIYSFRTLLKRFFPIVNVRTNTNLVNFQKRQIFKFINRIFPLRRALLRFLSKILALELLAECEKGDSTRANNSDCNSLKKERCRKLGNICQSCISYKMKLDMMEE